MKNLNDFALQYLQSLKQQSAQLPVSDTELSGSTMSQLDNIYPTVYQTETNATVIALSNQAEILAAVSGRFVPNDLLLLTSDASTHQQVLNRLVSGCIVETVDSKVQWLLNQSRRETALRPLIKTGTLDVVLSQPLPATDLLGKMLRDILNEGADFSIANRTHTELLAISAAAEALADVNVPLPDRNQLHYQLNKESLLAGYDVLLKGTFIGRKPQLQTLDLFLRQGNEKAGSNQWSGLIVTGYGGAGKSTLLAKFAQRVVKKRLATVVMLDFDRPGIDPSPNDTFWLEAEMTRQVGLQYPKHYERLLDIRHQTRQRRTEFVSYEGLTQSADSFSKHRNVRSSLVLAIKNALQSERMEHRPLLLVLDTFEEVIQRELARRVFDWLAEIGDALSPAPLRVIFSGRLFDTSLAVFARQGLDNPLLVNELEPNQAERLLKHLNVAEPMAKRLIRSGLFPLRPLELQLLAKVANRDESAASIEELEAEIRDGGEKSNELFIGIIYRRILLRIKDPATELLAYPGLVLRYVTPELIQKVLGPALALPVFTLEEAEKALKKLATYEWLVEQKINYGRLEVWHRRDLRQSMLRLMLTDDPTKTRRISEAASQYFSNGSERDQAEALYHRLLWMDTPVEGEQYELDQLRQMAVILGGYVSDLPKVAMVMLQFAQKGSVQASDVNLLPARYLLSAYYKTGRRLINSREFAKALRLIRRGQKEGIFGQQAQSQITPDLWEKDTLFATACWSELSYKSSDIPIANTPLQDVANRFYPAAITAPSDVLLNDITNWLGKIDHLSTSQTAELQAPDIAGLLTNLALSIVAIHNRVPLTIDRRPIIRNIVETARSHLQLTRSARLQRKLVLLSFTGASPVIDSFWLAPSLLRFDLLWLQQLAKISQKVGLTEVNGLMNETITTFQTVLAGRQPTVRQLLRTMDSLYKERDQWAKVCFSLSADFNDSESLIALFRGPDSEFRDPCRFALLEAFPDPSSRRQLAQLIQLVVPLPLIDLTPDAFGDSMAADPEHALESYIELVDRAWQLGPLLRLAATGRPDATKLKAVLLAYERWDIAVRSLFTSFFNSIHKT